jgi:hypothetical protein
LMEKNAMSLFVKRIHQHNWSGARFCHPPNCMKKMLNWKKNYSVRSWDEKGGGQNGMRDTCPMVFLRCVPCSSLSLCLCLVVSAFPWAQFVCSRFF